MEENNKTTAVKQLLLRKSDSDTCWYDLINDTGYYRKDMLKLIEDGWKIVKIDDSLAGTQTYMHGRITILLEKS